MEPSPSPIRHLWPLIFANGMLAMTYGFFIVMLLMSELMFPGEPFHAVEMGSVITARTWVLAFSGMLIGRIVDRHNRKTQLVISTAIPGIAFIAVGFLPEGLGFITYMGFVILYAITGFGNGGFLPTILSYTNDALDPHTRSRFFGLMNASGQVANLVGLIMSAYLIQGGLWRFSYWLVGSFVLVGALLIAVKIKEPKRGSKHQELKEVLASDDKHYTYELTRKTVKATFFKPTNVIAFMEGLFTCILLSSTNFLVLPYLQSDPYNVSASSTSFFLIIFGLPGALLGSIAFGRLSDRLGARNIKHRLTLIGVSVFVLTLGQILLFLIPFPFLSVTEGYNLGGFLLYPIVWVLGGIMLMIRAFQGIYDINQPPILQAINVPEAQGTITAWNQFLETIGRGAAPLIAGAALTAMGDNYLLAAAICCLFGLPGGFMWLFARGKIDGDITFINTLLKGRAAEIRDKGNE